MNREDDVDSLTEFLAEKSRAGETVTHSDHFTISPEKAWDKLSAHAFPFKEAWVLEVVRAAVLGGCSGLKVTQSTARTTLKLQRSEVWEPEQIIDSLLNFESEAAPYLRRLSGALRALAKTLGNPFSVYTVERKVLSWTGTRLELDCTEYDLPAEFRPEQGDLVISVSNSTREDRSFFSKLFKIEERTFTANISALLYRRAFCCPIPVTVDSRSVRGLQAFLQSSQGTTSQPLMQLRVPPSDEIPAFPPPQIETWEKPQTDSPIAIVSSSDPAIGTPMDIQQSFQAFEQESVGVVVVLKAFLRRDSTRDSFLHKRSETSAWKPGSGTSYLLWVLDGVVVEEEKLHSGAFGLLVLASAERLKTDLSGYRLVRAQQFAQRRASVLSAASAAVLETLESQYLTHAQDLNLSAFDLLFRAVCAAAGMFFVIPGLLFLVDLAYGVSQVRDLEKGCREAFEKEFLLLEDQLKAYL